MRRIAFAVAVTVALAGAAAAWAEVVDRLRNPEPILTSGTPAAIVWSDRVFRSEAELAGWLAARGVSYERWARRHPEAVEILRSRGRGAATASRVEATAGPAGPPRQISSRVAEAYRAVSSAPFLRAAVPPFAGTLALLLALAASVPVGLTRKAGATPSGALLRRAAAHRASLYAAAFLLGAGTLIGTTL